MKRRLSTTRDYLVADLSWAAFKDRVRRELLAAGHNAAANAMLGPEGSPLTDAELAAASPTFVWFRELWRELGGTV